MSELPILSYCHRCDRHAGGVCRESKRKIQAHKAAMYCPHPQGPRFGTATKPADWDSTPPAATVAPATPPVARPPAAVPRSDWPAAVQMLARLARDGDKGIGDVAHRVAATSGAEGLAKLFTKLTGRACGCADRAKRLNELYPL